MGRVRPSPQLGAVPAFEPLEPRLLLDGQPYISEFVAINKDGLQAEDGSRPDWLEIHNPDTSSVSLAGWRLRDSADTWSLPDMALGPGEFLVVFCSGEDKVTAGGEIHTSFRLDGDGEYLALLDADGVVQEFDPFPSQHRDVSYGIAQDVQETHLVAAGDAATYLVPQNGQLGLNWTLPGFVEQGWTPGATGLGYELSTPGFAVRNYKANTSVGSLDVAELVIATPGYQTTVYTENPAVVNYMGTNGGGHFGSDVGFPGMVINVDYDDFVVEATGIVTIPTAGWWTFGVNSDDGFSLELDNGTASYGMLFPDPRAAADTLQAFDIAEAGDYELRLVFYERGGGSELELFAAPGSRGAYDATFRLVGDTAGGGLAVRSRPIGSGEGGAGLAGLIETDLQDDLFEVSAAAYVRIPFQVADPGALESLTLKMKYDDGYVAYLNGTKIAEKNAPASPGWDSHATDARSTIEATTFENVDVSPYLDRLQAGENVLALHALNVDAGDEDFLLLPELSEITYTGLGEHYFAVPTPWDPNGEGFWAFVEDTKFSVDRGFFDEAFYVTITTATEDAEIYYTTDGSQPSPTHGTPYENPIYVETTTILRAAAFQAGYEPSNVDTQTYIFLEDVIHQPASPEGFPSAWGATTADYEMDLEVVNNPLYGDTLIDDLKSIPTMSLVMNVEDVFGAGGIYSNSWSEGVAWERAGSVELIDPEGDEEFQVNCGVRIYGGVSRAEWFPKHTFRLLFKADYGPTKLDFPLFEDSPVDQFDTIILRGGFNNSWPMSNNSERNRAQYIRDQWAHDIQIAMGQLSCYGTFVHLYVNGLYWGLYNPVDRPNASFMAEHLGSEKEDYDALNSYPRNVVDGTADAWIAAQSTAAAGVADAAGYDALAQYVDMPNLADYMILNFYGGNHDWDDHNWYAGRLREEGAGWMFFSWDAERILEGLYDDRTEVGQYDKPSNLHKQLRANPEYRVLFGDRVHRHFFNDGALTPGNAAATWIRRADEIDRAIVGESARWGDAKREPPYTRDAEWIAEENRLLNDYFPNRTGVVLQQLINDGLYPGVEAPVFALNGTYQHGGLFATGDLLSMNAPAGTIYYTLDGTDPRLPGGGVSPHALQYTGALALPGSRHVKARAYTGTEWSALNEASFLLDTVLKLRITELMYHPAAPTDEEQSAGFAESDDFEFLELTNTGDETVELAGIRFTDGIDFTFPDMSLAAGQRVVVVENRDAFEFRYGIGTAVIAGEFVDSTLDGAGERVRLDAPLGGVIHDFKYRDGWYDITDGQGFSLVIRDPGGDRALWDEREGWRASERAGGNPGEADNGLDPGAVIITEVLAHSDGIYGDWIELYNTTDADVPIGGWFLSDSATELTKYQFPAGTIVPAGQYRVFTEVQHFGASDFALSEFGDDVYLSSGVGDEAGGYREHVDFGASPNSMAIGLYTKSTGGTDFTLLLSPTPWADNAQPFLGPLVVNELMYHPVAPQPPGPYDNDDYEFVELYNRSGATLNLTEFYVSNGIGFTFGWYGTDVSGTAVHTLQAGATATWPADLPQIGDWEVLVRWNPLDAEGHDRNLDCHAFYEIDHAGGPAVVEIDQDDETYTGDWLSLGTYAFDAGATSVTLTRGTNNPVKWTLADQVKFVRGATEILVDDDDDPGFSTSQAAVTTLAPSGYVVLVRDLEAFDERYDIQANNIPVAGQYTGNLANDGDKVKVLRADVPEATGYIPYVRSDYVNYDDRLPWPTGPDGAGSALNRQVINAYGNDPDNWATSTAGGTPGAENQFIDTSPPSAPQDVAATAASPTQIDLTWSPAVDNQSGVAFYVVYRDATQIDTATLTSYRDEGLEQTETYVYQIAAVNHDGYEGQPSTGTDATPCPSVQSAYAADATHVTVIFGKPVEQGSAQNADNYRIADDQGQPVSVLAAAREANPQIVTLAVGAPLAKGTSYTVTVSHVEDLAGNRVQTGSQVGFVFHNVDPALVGWWTFDEGTGGTAGDASGHGHDAQVQGATWQPGLIGGALRFNGTTDQVVDEDAEDYLNQLDAVTVALWIKSEVTGTDRGFITTQEPGSSACLNIRYDVDGWGGGGTNVIKAYLQTDEGHRQNEGESGMHFTRWEHVAVTWASGGGVLIYVDGRRQTLTFDQGILNGTLTSTDKLILGKGYKTSDGAWQGLLDDVRIYNRALSDEEIAALANLEPLAVNDDPASGVEYRVHAGQQLTVDAAGGVLANDSDPDAGPQPLTATLVQDVPFGQLVLAGDGSFQYTPDPAHDGPVAFTYQPFDGREYGSIATVVITVVNLTPPTVLSVERNAGLWCPGRLTSAAVRFSQDVAASLEVADLLLHNDSTGADVDLSAATLEYDAQTNTALWDLAAVAIEPGQHTATLLADGVTNGSGVSLDGNGDGQEGGDYVEGIPVAIPGDADLDGTVDFHDYLIVKTHFGAGYATWADGDFDADWDVDLDDYAAARDHFGQALSAPAAEVIAAPVVRQASPLPTLDNDPALGNPAEADPIETPLPDGTTDDPARAAEQPPGPLVPAVSPAVTMDALTYEPPTTVSMPATSPGADAGLDPAAAQADTRAPVGDDPLDVLALPSPLTPAI